MLIYLQMIESEEEQSKFKAIYEKYKDLMFYVANDILHNEHDAEDAVQETLLRYLQRSPEFENEEHEKAWLIKVAVNQCRDILRYKRRHPIADKEAITEFAEERDESGYGL